jgi:hypothetical protein
MLQRRPGFLLVVAIAQLAGCVAPPVLSPAEDRAYEVSAAWVNGRPAVAWYGGRLPHEAIFLQFADLNGRATARPIQLTDASRDAYEPSLQALSGDVIVAWYEQETAPRGAPRRQWALLARFDATGRKLWQRQLSGEGVNGRIPVVRVVGEQIEVAWLEEPADASPMLRVAGLDGKGNWRQAPRDAAVVGRDSWNLNAAIAPDGAFHVVFDSSHGSAAKELHWVVVKGDRVEDHRVSRDDGAESAYPDIAFDAQRYAVTWFDSRDGNQEVYLRCGSLGSAGLPGLGLQLDDPSAYRVTRTPEESIGAYVTWYKGRIELAWTEGRDMHRALRRQPFDRDCRPLGGAQRVDSAGAEAGIPSLASSPAGLALAWNGQRGDPSTPVHGHSRKLSSVVLLRIKP